MTKIEWTHRPGTEGESWNPIAGCTKVSPGCANCYAERMAARLEGMTVARMPIYADINDPKYKYLHVLDSNRKWNGKIVCDDKVLLKPLKWRKPRTIFVSSMADLFHEDVPFEFIDKVFAVMALCPQHTFQVLTKRPETMLEYTARRKLLTGGTMMGGQQPWKTSCDWVYKIVRETIPDAPLVWPLPNVWLGASCEDQQRADERIPHLRRCPAAVRFLSCEPLLGKIDLWFDSQLWARMPHVDTPIRWVVVGGESGPGARACGVEWIRSLVQQGKAAGVPVFVKQLGGHPDKRNNMAEWPEDLRVREFANVGACPKGGG